MAIKVTHTASSMDDLADYLLLQSNRRREEAAHARTKGRRQELLGEASGLQMAAEIVRDTTVPA